MLDYSCCCQNLSQNFSPMSAQHFLSVKLSSLWAWQHKFDLLFYEIWECLFFVNSLSWVYGFWFSLWGWWQMSSCNFQKSAVPTPASTFQPCHVNHCLPENNSFFRDWLVQAGEVWWSRATVVDTFAPQPPLVHK